MNDGFVLFTGDSNATIKLWVEVFNPVMHIEVESQTNVSVSAAFESWRYQDHVMVAGEQGELNELLFSTSPLNLEAQSSWGMDPKKLLPVPPPSKTSRAFTAEAYLAITAIMALPYSTLPCSSKT